MILLSDKLTDLEDCGNKNFSLNKNAPLFIRQVFGRGEHNKWLFVVETRGM